MRQTYRKSSKNLQHGVPIRPAKDMPEVDQFAADAAALELRVDFLRVAGRRGVPRLHCGAFHRPDGEAELRGSDAGAGDGQPADVIEVRERTAGRVHGRAGGDGPADRRGRPGPHRRLPLPRLGRRCVRSVR